MELTINHIIKIVLAVFVIAVLVIGIYFGFRNYVIPYFEGVGPSGSSSSGEGSFGGSADVCDGKKPLGEIVNRETPSHDYIDLKSGKTKIFLDGGDVRFDGFWSNPKIGDIDGVKIEILQSHLNKPNAQDVNNALIGGSKVCI